jgi:glycopeptide antibiotics resistance protein
MKRRLAIVYSYVSILWLGLILVVTLVPLESTAEKRPILCALCRDGAVSDGIVNATLFLPLGAALGIARRRWLSALAPGALLSLGVEGAQHLIPGRDLSLLDVLSNTMGTSLGIALVRSVPRWSRPGARLRGVIRCRRSLGRASPAPPLRCGDARARTRQPAAMRPCAPVYHP